MIEKRKYFEMRIGRWNDLFSINQNLFSSFVFRGQGNEKWPLETSLRRMTIDYHTNDLFKSAPDMYEMEMVKEFKWKYPGYQSNPNMVPKDEEIIEWLSIMQHFGAKTRLLDFSNSIYVALYMAIYGSNNTDAAVWALNKNMIYRFFFDVYRADGKLLSQEELEQRIYAEAQDRLNSIEKEFKDECLFIVKPRICNERISRQQGLFVIPSSISLPFMDLLANHCDMANPLTTDYKDFARMTNVSQFINECGLIKFTIPNDLRYDLTRALQQMNISAETMYPGLEGLAQSVNRYREIRI
jgi:hypothetical protein